MPEWSQSLSETSVRLVQSLTRPRTRDAMPRLIGDIYDSIKSWGTEGQLDPFNALYSVSTASSPAPQAFLLLTPCVRVRSCARARA